MDALEKRLIVVDKLPDLSLHLKCHLHIIAMESLPSALLTYLPSTFQELPSAIEKLGADIQLHEAALKLLKEVEATGTLPAFLAKLREAKDIQRQLKEAEMRLELVCLEEKVKLTFRTDQLAACAALAELEIKAKSDVLKASVVNPLKKEIELAEMDLLESWKETVRWPLKE